MTYFFGILAIAVGVGMVIWTEWIVSNFGTNAWAEEHLGTSGGSRLLYKLLGIGVIFIALMAMTGMLGEIILGTLGSLFGVPKQ